MAESGAFAWLDSLPRHPASPAPARMRVALARLGHPEAVFDAVHVAGTNGKGSVAALVAAGLEAEGRRTGLYTSPHLARWGERIRIRGLDVSDGRLAGLLAEVRRVAPPDLTAFDALTLAAFKSFADDGVEVAVVECGMGARLDSTNVLPRVVASAVTTVGFDHTEFLGGTRKAIAREKLGLDHLGRILATAETDRALRPLFEERVAREPGCRLAFAGEDVRAVRIAEGLDGQRVRLEMRHGDRVVDDAPLPLLGDHQLANAAVAYAILDALDASDDAIRRGFAAARWPARLEVLRARDRTWLLDCAHNAHAVEAVLPTLVRLMADHCVTLVVGAGARKDAQGLAGAIARIPHERCVVTRASYGGFEASAFAVLLVRAKALDVRVVEPVEAAVDAAAEAGADIVVVLGSLHLAGEVRAILHP